MALWLTRMVLSSGKSHRKRSPICFGLRAIAQRRLCRRPCRRPSRRPATGGAGFLPRALVPVLTATPPTPRRFSRSTRALSTSLRGYGSASTGWPNSSRSGRRPATRNAAEPSSRMDVGSLLIILDHPVIRAMPEASVTTTRDDHCDESE